MIKLFYILGLQLFLIMNLFAQTIKIESKIAPILEKRNFYYCDCSISLVRIYLNSYLKDTTFLKNRPFSNLDSPIYIGTVSDLDGKFSLEIPDKYYNDSLVFEHWAYKTKKIFINELRNSVPSVITMEDKLILLPVLKIKKFKSNKLPQELIDNPKYTPYKEIKNKTYSEYEFAKFCGQDPTFFSSYISKMIKTKKVRIKKPLVVEFIVTRTGKLIEIEVLGCNSKATNEKIKHIFEQSPKWSPGRATGPPINYHFALPIILSK